MLQECFFSFDFHHELRFGHVGGRLAVPLGGW
jgi:hypothetical protein